ncbi:LON peptidase substrate-binding domain-containing protein [Thalassotalea profundi]|uniref:ATP-dependent protease n=1 Tax=Thalassotalea profundi TaxID=2036687 RepID=A0ABQ3II23_9GAMM|nr:LON peptidase substrate-binding domain-containing protein [Thalassotalea profundi]GHE81413.1 ATP-dependent protease [Thalassotalea profundi]
MTKAVVNLPIFPLPVYLLPEGITRLRIFEQRYLKMIKIATKGQGFVIFSAIDKNIDAANKSNLFWGSCVEIINFDQSKDGVLEVDVKCKSLVEILSTTVDDDNLMFGDVIQLPHWSQTKSPYPLGELSTSLESLFNNNPLLDALYPKKNIDNEVWVVARWLELLPVSSEIKNSFVTSQNYEAARGFVESIFLNSPSLAK